MLLALLTIAGCGAGALTSSHQNSQHHNYTVPGTPRGLLKGPNAKCSEKCGHISKAQVRLHCRPLL